MFSFCQGQSWSNWIFIVSGGNFYDKYKKCHGAITEWEGIGSPVGVSYREHHYKYIIIIHDIYDIFILSEKNIKIYNIYDIFNLSDEDRVDWVEYLLYWEQIFIAKDAFSPLTERSMKASKTQI